jgi:DNA-3-methyladenine glycosylase II
MKLNPSRIQAARCHLRASDPVMGAMIDAVGPYTLRFERDRFGMLVRSIVSQQISTAAARAIRHRLYQLAGPGGLTADNLLRFSPDQLRAVGLSQQKSQYVKDLALLGSGTQHRDRGHGLSDVIDHNWGDGSSMVTVCRRP